MPQKLREHTVELPLEGGAAALALQAAMDDLSHVLMLVFGTGKGVEQVVDDADTLCKGVSGVSWREVVWVKNPAAAEVAAILSGIKGHTPGAPACALSFDREGFDLEPGKPLDPIHLERAFMRAGG